MGRISMPQGKGSQLHNRREYEKIGKPMPENIDKKKSHENITLVDRDIREAYEEIFGEALAAYNSKQKRADRKIENYYDHIQKSKNGEKLFYEDVVQWGSKEDFENPRTRQIAREALMKYAISFEEKNPNLKLIGAYIHMDEASPHLHIDYIPVAHGYKRGLSTRNSLDRAMKEMGFEPENESRKNNATKLWKENERERFATICRNLGLEVEEERAARGSLSVEEYKEARDKMFGGLDQELQEARSELEQTQGDLGDLETEKTALESIVEPLRGKAAAIERIEVVGTRIPFTNKLAVTPEELDALKEQAAQAVFVEERKNALAERERFVIGREIRSRDDMAIVAQKEAALRKEQAEFEQQKKMLNQRIAIVEEHERAIQHLRAMPTENADLRVKMASMQVEITDLKAQVQELTTENKKLSERLVEVAEGFKRKLRSVYYTLTAAVKAVGMLKYDKTNGYKVEKLTKAQSRLIDAIAAYAARLAREDGHADLAEDMDHNVDIIPDIKVLAEPPKDRPTQSTTLEH